MNSEALTLPDIEVRNLIASRTSTRVEDWEVNFEKNHKSFAEGVAFGIAKHIIEDLRKTLSDPYAKSLSSKDKNISDISLDITKSHSAKQIMNFAASTANLPPFKEWLTKFSTEQNRSDHDFFDEGSIGVNRKYFQELMAIVGRLAAQKLNELLVSFTSSPQHADLQFKVDWYSKSDQQFSNPSDFRDNCLRIKLCFKKEAEIQQSTQSQDSFAITQHRIQQKKIQQIRMRNNLLIALVVAIIGLFILKSGLLEIALSPTQNKS